MNHLGNLLAAVGIGAGIAYLFDPQSGRRRRALLRDKLVRTARESGHLADARMRDIRNRAYGTYQELSKDVKQVTDAASDAARRVGSAVQSVRTETKDVNTSAMK